MPEIGLVHFARVARQVAEATLPAYRTRYSKHTFTQPALLAVLCVMRYEDWTYRETEVRLMEHHELCEALGLSRVPDHTTLYCCLQRLTEQEFTYLLDATVQAMPPPPWKAVPSRWTAPVLRLVRSARSLSIVSEIRDTAWHGATGSNG